MAEDAQHQLEISELKQEKGANDLRKMNGLGADIAGALGAVHSMKEAHIVDAFKSWLVIPLYFLNSHIHIYVVRSYGIVCQINECSIIFLIRSIIRTRTNMFTSMRYTVSGVCIYYLGNIFDIMFFRNIKT